jgi:hypothetical protein
MCRPTSGAQDRVISNKIRSTKTRTEEQTMMFTPEPFMTAEIRYRQRRVSQLYDKKRSSGRRRHRWVPRLPSLSLPRPVAALGGRGLSKTAE